jgi:transposase, IS30 family
MRTNSYTHMSIDERETLSLGLAQGHSLRTMATVLGRSPSTVSREYVRNAREHPYRACLAQRLAVSRARQPRRPRKLRDPWLWQYVQTHLGQGHSPEQIAGRLRREYPDDMRKRLSTETIYVALYVLPRGTLRTELLAALRQARKARRPRSRGTDRRGQLLHMTSIADRPAEVASRTVPGHWEGDLLKGARNGSAVGTLVERTTRLVILARMEGTDAVSDPGCQ